LKHYNNPTSSTIGIDIDYTPLTQPATLLKENNIFGGDIGMQFTNAYGLTILNNNIANSLDGIVFSNTSDFNCINNNLSNNLPTNYLGIFLNSSSGNLRGNEISGYSRGIWLANSSPYLAQNIIHNNLFNGIYIGAGSTPYLDRYYHQEEGCDNLVYPFSGFNRVYENGGYTNNPTDDGTEIYFSYSNAFMSDGCNTIADDRAPNPPALYNTRILLNGTIYSPGTAWLDAVGNYWGNNPLYGGNNPRDRFGDLNVHYDPYLTVPCSTFGEGCGWIITDRSGNVIDTLYPAESSGEGSELSLLYSTADSYLQNNQLEEARNVYNQIINSYGNDIQSINAYNKLLTLGYLQGQTPEQLEQLRVLYMQKSADITDSLFSYALKQLARLTLIAKKEYENAIDQFDDIVQQLPGTEKALYAEIDAITTALLLDENGMGKASKYSVGSPIEFGSKVKSLLQSYLNGEYQSKSLQVPKEYILSQNYPNPFNPTTTIKYAIPKTVNVELKVFDILGREVKTLVNETKNAGYYEVQFNASNFASGVYFYRLRAGDYIKTGKMLLLK
jgi:parallel beta-helix repeat protein